MGINFLVFGKYGLNFIIQLLKHDTFLIIIVSFLLIEIFNQTHVLILNAAFYISCPVSPLLSRPTVFCIFYQRTQSLRDIPVKFQLFIPFWILLHCFIHLIPNCIDWHISRIRPQISYMIIFFQRLLCYRLILPSNTTLPISFLKLLKRSLTTIRFNFRMKRSLRFNKIYFFCLLDSNR